MDKKCKFCGGLLSEHIDGIECPDDNAVYGRTMEVVAQYASTCDGCGDLTMHEMMEMDEETQLGYCEECIRKRNEQTKS